MTGRVLVIGGGISGTAAVHGLTSKGTACLWVRGTSGATSATSGALDWVATSSHTQPTALSPELISLGERLAWRLPKAGTTVATWDGAIRPARGSDAAVLDLTAHRGGVIGVLDCGRLGWDAEGFCAALNETRWAKESASTFLRLEAIFDRLDPNASKTDRQIAETLAAGRESWLEKLHTALAAAPRKPEAVLTGPWLATDTTTVPELSAAVGIPFGETLSAAWGLAGVRFDAAREAVLGPLVECVDGHTSRLEANADSVTATLASPDARALTADRCVLAIGGFAGGGIELGPNNRVRASLQTGGALAWQLDGRPWLHPASPGGLDVQSLGLSALERLGFAPAGPGALIAAAGDIVADSPRVMLRAAQSGLDAAARFTR